MTQQFNQSFEHQDSERQEVEAGQGRGQAFIVAGQAAKAGRPAEPALDHPPTRQEDYITLPNRIPSNLPKKMF